jgi:glycosyltransferase involved in cell wall biosynthesis
MATLVIWHGYLLGGTGSNIYSRYLARAWVAAGHHVVLMCQEPHPEQFEFVQTVERVADGALVDSVDLVAGGADGARDAGQGSCRMVRTDIGQLLPVYLLDRYEGFSDVRRYVEMADDEIEAYCATYAEAMRWVIETYEPDGVILNHAVMGPAAMRDVLEAHGIPYAVKIHGSELEYCIVEDERFIAPAQRGLEGATRVLVGSDHIERRMNELLGATCSEGRVDVVPPGVDLDLFTPVADGDDSHACQRELVRLLRERGDAGDGRPDELQHEIELIIDGEFGSRIEALSTMYGRYAERDVERGAYLGLAGIDLSRHDLVVYVGKLIRQKGVHLLVAAWPLVLARRPEAQLVITGFGMLRDGLAAFVVALANGNMDAIRELARDGGVLDGPPGPLSHLEAFYDGLSSRGELDAYMETAHELGRRIVFTGQVDHAVLRRLWPLAEASVVPSVGAEAFGMVSAEAAACGCPPVVSHHSGLAAVADAIASSLPAELGPLLSFDVDAPDAIEQLADRIVGILELSDSRRAELREGVRLAVEREWGWAAIADSVARPLLGVRAH